MTLQQSRVPDVECDPSVGGHPVRMTIFEGERSAGTISLSTSEARSLARRLTAAAEHADKLDTGDTAGPS